MGFAASLALACSGGDGGDDGGPPGTGGAASGGSAIGGAVNGGAGAKGSGGTGGKASGGNQGATGGSITATGGTSSPGGRGGGSPTGGRGGVNGTGGMSATGGTRTGGRGGASGGGAATGGAASGGSGGSTGTHNPMSAEMIQAYVDAHNKARAGQIVTLTPAPSPALPPVTWDPILADSAYAYTMKCTGDGNLLNHNANRSADYKALGGKDNYVGENIYGSSGRTVDPLAVVTAWVNEASKYTYGPITSAAVSAAGHYTQVVWRDSVRIGCAFYDCASLTYRSTVLCDYAPGGNITGSAPY